MVSTKPIFYYYFSGFIMHTYLGGIQLLQQILKLQ
jgi:hypothetical protein